MSHETAVGSGPHGATLAFVGGGASLCCTEGRCASASPTLHVDTIRPQLDTEVHSGTMSQVVGDTCTH